eukprot:7002365-Alexandrium_andersonii.AAC.1
MTVRLPRQASREQPMWCFSGWQKDTSGMTPKAVAATDVDSSLWPISISCTALPSPGRIESKHFWTSAANAEGKRRWPRWAPAEPFFCSASM